MKPGTMRITYWMAAFIVRTLAKIFLGLRIYGAENVPREGKLLLVSNHISNLDPPILGSVIPREIFYAAKIQLFKGYLGKVVSHLNAIPVRREGSDKDAIIALRNALLEEKGVLIFPEGTRTLDPSGKDFKAGVGLLAMLSKANLQPIRIDGTHELKKAFFRKRPVTVKFGKVVELQPLIANSPSKKDSYKRITDALMAEVAKLS